MISRDGRRFHRWLEPVIPESAPHDRKGNRSNYMTWGMVEIPDRSNHLSVYATEAYYTGPDTRVRRFEYRKDGFVSLRAGAKGGLLVTKPLALGRLAAHLGRARRLVVRAQATLQPVALDDPRRHRVHIDGKRSGLRCHRFGEADDPRLGRRIVGTGGNAAHLRCQRRDADDLAGAAFLHVPERLAADQEGATQIHRHGLVPLRGTDIEDRGEVQAGLEGMLPVLLENHQFQSELHSHSTWSDGKASIQTMAEEALARGLKVLAITDHTYSLRVANGLTVERLRQQRNDIEVTQRKLGDSILLLSLIHI